MPWVVWTLPLPDFLNAVKNAILIMLVLLEVVHLGDEDEVEVCALRISVAKVGHANGIGRDYAEFFGPSL